ncbi:hypothetical protein SAMN05660464_3622 [Geodermatophilus dictyosporus]|uniref:Transaldolase n=1 Tax=Geodermatophilus dictyosporus TaxID=1523247 RepID=A0A1I5RML6_9ACTN|nr:hypothetical protein [Geodermatophilus dictyosporus]SFP59792.1 hypothetical protein SAMN05660464_3622 [Geodermatophilus dictyosporus]
MRELFTRLFDDAALFPPGNAPMAAAVPAHRGLEERLGDLVGPFVVPAARLDELTEHLRDGDPFDVSLLAAAGDLPAAAARVGADPRLRLAAVEVPVVADAAAAGRAVRVLDDVVPAGVPAAVELPRTGARDAVLDVLAGTGVRAKLRTGGLRADLFPPAEELAATLAACVARGVPLKCTAGLHSAVAHHDPATGFTHHGFLNALAACDALAAGGPAAAAEQWLRQDDPGVLVEGWSPDRAARARAVLTSFGTCSVLAPVDDLVRLGLLPAHDRMPA